VRRRARQAQSAGTPIVVDASLVVALIANEERSEDAEKVLLGDQPLLAPDFLLLEAANAFWKKLRRRDWDLEKYRGALAQLQRIEIVLIPTESLAFLAAALAAEQDHPVYDCAYIALAQARGGALATFDTKRRQLAELTHLTLWAPSPKRD
jgi:predicted nucleic acid-binding protein